MKTKDHLTTSGLKKQQTKTKTTNKTTKIRKLEKV
jgi:hypothetical protein